MEIVIKIEEIENMKLADIQRKINQIREKNEWCQIVLDFKEGILTHSSVKKDEIY